MQAFSKTQLDDHEDALITLENESKLWERRLRRDEGVAPTKYVDGFHGNTLHFWFLHYKP